TGAKAGGGGGRRLHVVGHIPTPGEAGGRGNELRLRRSRDAEDKGACRSEGKLPDKSAHDANLLSAWLAHFSILPSPPVRSRHRAAQVPVRQGTDGQLLVIEVIE